MADLSLSELRALASKRHRAAGSKVSRLRKQGIDPVEVDPRRAAQNINKYNRKQLESYINKLNTFTDRKTQFVRGRAGKPITREAFVSYERAQLAYNLRVEKYVKEFGDYKIPTMKDTTVKQRLKDRGQRERGQQRMGDGFGIKPTDVIERSSGTFGDERAMRAFEKKLRTRIGATHHNRRVSNHKAGATEMLEWIGDRNLSERVNKLSRKQFDLLWNFTPFARATALNYENIKSGNMQDVDHQIAKNSMTEAEELLSWAERQEV